MRNRYDAFWFPSSARNEIITSETKYDHLHFRDGTIVADGKGDNVVSVRWPRLDLATWQWLVSDLRENQKRVRMDRWRERLPQALRQMRSLWADQDNPLRASVLEGLESCTGHSAGMLNFALNLFDLISVEDLQQAAACQLPHAVKDEFVALDGLAGRLRFFEEGAWGGLRSKPLLKLDGYRSRPWRMRPTRPDLMLGFAAGNVPGTGLLLILLGLAAATDVESGPPVIIVKNSRREPLFTPLVLSALELVDPSLLATTAVTIWDYADPILQGYLIGQADLVIAAASDETIDEIGQTVDMISSRSRPIRFHRHGHKVSFSTVGHECLESERTAPVGDLPLLKVVALLASLDVALWNQQGCLSSRVHFVEVGDNPYPQSLEAYAGAIVDSLRFLDQSMPKGVSRKRQIHNLFDKYQAIASGGEVRVFSEYDDNFLVVLEQRALTTDQFREVVNDCQGRSVVLIPVDDVMEVPEHYLRHLPSEQLQSMSVAVGEPAYPGIDPRLLHYAEALGEVGISGIRTVGRGAFPQLAYSWDGLIPLDLTVERARGHFTALEFDQPWPQIYETYRLVEQALGL